MRHCKRSNESSECFITDRVFRDQDADNLACVPELETEDVAT